MLKETNELINVFTTYPQLVSILSTRNLTKEDQKKIIDKIFANKIDLTFLNFFKLLVDRKFFFLVVFILKKFRNLCNEKLLIIYGTIFSTTKLSSNQINKIAKKISKKFNSKVELINKIDSSLIAGVKVKIKDQIFDGSIQGQLLVIKKKLTEI